MAVEVFKIEDLSFTYPGRDKEALSGVNLTVNRGEFVTLCGFSGCGKTTLLRLLKPAISPHGKKSGNIYYDGLPLSDCGERRLAQEIGFVMQNPDNQTVTDKVWHEMAFGLESLGYDNEQIRQRVAETASFFGLQGVFHQSVSTLSGGQKQLLALASVMVMQPSVLILDEPTSNLCPISAHEFMSALERINKETGTTVIISEHRLEEAFPMSDRVIVMDEGKIIADEKPSGVAGAIRGHGMCAALPAPLRISCAVEDGVESRPYTVRDGKVWLEKYAESHTLRPELIKESKKDFTGRRTVVELENVYFRYEKELPDVIRGMSAQIYEGEIYSVVGGNGTGKTTALSIMSGLLRPYRGKVRIDGEDIERADSIYGKVLGVLPQDPQTLFARKTVRLDLLEMLSDEKITDRAKEKMINEVSELCMIDELLDAHPYDLSGGEQQRAAMAKVLLRRPKILMLDEPTKFMDARYKQIFAAILKKLSEKGITVVMVSHDVEFCAENADRCAFFFDGRITSCSSARDVFSSKSYYTTFASRMARSVLPRAVTTSDVILGCGKEPPESSLPLLPDDFFDSADSGGESPQKGEKKAKKIAGRTVGGIVFSLIFAAISVLRYFGAEILNIKIADGADIGLLQILSVIFAIFAVICFFPQSKETEFVTASRPGGVLSRRTLLSLVLLLIAVPLTILFGMYFLYDRKYYFISLLIILETMIPFFAAFERRRPKAREIVVISVLCAIAVMGRTAFFMLPHFKPVLAIIIISGVTLGAETGFLIGAVTGFVSNFVFGQGPWTPWQMFAFGIVGFIAGLLSAAGIIGKSRTSLCIFGALSALIIYGGIMNPVTVLLSQNEPTLSMVLASYVTGIPFDLVHAISTAFFLWFAAEPMAEKIERIKVKYGLWES